MNVLVVGDESSALECQQKFGATHHYIHQGVPPESTLAGDQPDVVFDFLVSEVPSFEFYRGRHCPVFFNTSKISLHQLSSNLAESLKVGPFGFAGLPTFLNREILEVSLYAPEDRQKLNAICQQLNTSFQIVGDRVGLVTPRVICRIINEAYYTVEDGTASREDIDLAMKLGTHYPLGPFEWCRKIGIRHVYELLEAVYQESRDERYKICSLLKKESLVV